MINVIKKMSYFLVMMVIGYGLGTNIYQMVSNHKTITYHFGGKTMTEIQTLKKGFEEKKKSIDGLEEGTFTKEEIETIQSDLGVVEGMLSEMNIWSLKGKKSLNIHDVYVLKEEIYSLSLLSITSLSTIKSHHGDESISKLLESSLVTSSAYAKEDLEDLEMSYNGNVTLHMDASIQYLKNYMTILNTLSDWVLKEGMSHA